MYTMYAMNTKYINLSVLDMHHILRHPLINQANPQNRMEPTITLSVDKFKEILLHSWHLLSPEKKQELRSIGIYPK